MYKLVFIAMAFFPLSCGASGTKIAEAFATMDQAQLLNFVDSTNSDAISRLKYGRGQNVVHAAIINPASPQAIQLAYEHGADLNHADNDGRTPLHHTIDANLPDAAQTLVELGAQTDIPNEAGFTAISFCQVVLESEPDHATCLIINPK